MRRDWLPELALVARLQDDRNPLGDARSGLVGVGLRWSVFDATRGRREAAARAAERAAAAQLRAERDRVRLEVSSAWRRARAARERLEAARGGAEEGREALRVVQERRVQGLATLTDELETEAASLAAELEELQAAAQVALADAALERAAGSGSSPAPAGREP
jgi:outer membrane protein TolC